MEWTQSLRKAIGYMEEHLLEDIGGEDGANAVHMSPLYFQKGFTIMTGYSPAEYIRMRRLYLAGLDCLSGREKVIDLAYKYGYQTPESFSKAFSRFHGVSPAQLGRDPSRIKVFLPLKVTVIVRGGNDMDYTVEKMDTLKLIGYERTFSFDTAYKEIPKLWAEFCKGCERSDNNTEVERAVRECLIGEFGVSIDEGGGKEFRYLIAGKYDGREVPEGMKAVEIEPMLWAKFNCCGPMPGALQAMNTKLFNEWLPGNPDYSIATGISIEWYSSPDISNPNYQSAIWLPVTKK